MMETRKMTHKFTPSVGRLTSKSSFIPRIEKQELTHRARRQVKKRFKKHPHSQFPQGHNHTHTTIHPVNQRVMDQFRLINEVSVQLFKKGYKRLTSIQQTRVFEFLNDSEHRQDWMRLKGMKEEKRRFTKGNDYVH